MAQNCTEVLQNYIISRLELENIPQLPQLPYLFLNLGIFLLFDLAERTHASSTPYPSRPDDVYLGCIIYHDMDQLQLIWPQEAGVGTEVGTMPTRP